MSSKPPFIVIIPGASQNPAHYGYLCHLFLLAGYPVLTALLPNLCATGPMTVEDDASFIRDKLLLPVLDYEERNVILLMHSYGGVPGSVSAHDLGPSTRLAQGKKTAVLGQIFMATMLVKGGDGKNAIDAFGGELPEHIVPDHTHNLLTIPPPLRIPTLYPDVPPRLAEAAAASSLPQGLHAFRSPIPQSSWANEEFRGRVACIRTTEDKAIPIDVQQAMLEESGVEWIVRDVQGGHSPQLGRAEEVVGIVEGIVGGWVDGRM